MQIGTEFMAEKHTLEELKSEVDNSSIFYKDFLKNFSTGKLNVDHVRYWFRQQYYFSVSLPSCFAALYARTPDIYFAQKQKLAGLFNIEAGGSKDKKAHSKYFKRLGSFLGFTDRDFASLSLQKPKDFTALYLKKRLEKCLGWEEMEGMHQLPLRTAGDYRTTDLLYSMPVKIEFDSQRVYTGREVPLESGLACVGLGNEYLNLKIFKLYREGIHKITGLKRCPTDYFDAHLQNEENDFKVFAGIFDQIVKSPDQIKVVKRDLRDLLIAREKYFASLHAQCSVCI